MNTTTQRSDTACDNAVGQFSHAHMGIVMQLDRLATLPALLGATAAGRFILVVRFVPGHGDQCFPGKYPKSERAKPNGRL